MMQLTYLTFTAPRRDDDAFASYKNRSKAELQNMDLNPQFFFQRLYHVHSLLETSQNPADKSRHGGQDEL